jgi:Ca2+-binding RTX toxin-like protein
MGLAGNDTYIVDNSDDVVIENVGEGTDTVLASTNYALAANVENLTLTGGAAINGTGNELNNILIGNAAENWLNGGAGNDTLNGGAGADTLVGGLGNDTYVIDHGGDVVIENAGEGTDTVQSSISYVLPENIENLTLTGTAAINATGNDLNNTLTGNSAANILAGKNGNDTYVVDKLGDVVIENANEGTDTVRSGITYVLPENVENLVLTGTGLIDGTGNNLGNVLTGNAVSNTLRGGAGNDTLNGGAGADRLAGGSGNDLYVVDDSGDVVIENAGEGTDTVQASVSYTLAANIENLTLTGSGSIDGSGNELANLLTGNAAANILNGGAGNDTLNGGAGADTLFGGLGDDLYLVDDIGDIVTENLSEGNDLVQSSVSYTLGANVENLTLVGSSAIDGNGNNLNNILNGNSAANVLNGGAGNDTLNGGAGADTLIGGLGDDLYIVDNAGDIVVENAGAGLDAVQSSVTWTLGANVEVLMLSGTGNISGTGNALDNLLTGNGGGNVLNGGAGTDILQGAAGNDTLTDTAGVSLLSGLSGNDKLTGGASNDLFIGGVGNDILTLGTGHDTVLFNSGDGQDSIVAGAGGDTLSLGLGIRQADLAFRKTGNDLILATGGADQITIKNWYGGTANKTFVTLQMITEATSDYNAGSANILINKKVETFGFQALVSAFDTARAAQPALTSWALTNTLLAAHLDGSDTAALGGDLAYQYGRYGSLSNVAFAPAQGVLNDAQFGVASQNLQSAATLGSGGPRLS